MGSRSIAGSPPDGIDSAPLGADWTAEGDKVYAYFGNSVGTAGDVNADGFDDVIVGARGFDGEYEGHAFAYHGSASGLSLTPAWNAHDGDLEDEFGSSVGTAGDVNGDGFDDVIVGDSYHDNGQTNEGAAFVYHGSASGLSTTPAWMGEADQDSASFGASVGTAGDVNGDGFDDVIVGAWNYDNGEVSEGAAFVYHGSASGLSTTPDWTGEIDQGFAHFGVSVGTAGDVNGDGFDDVIVGAYGYDDGEVSEGVAFVYHGSASGLALTPVWTAEGDQPLASFGISVSTAGDVNADGFDDVIVGADEYDKGQGLEGAAFAYHGSASGLSLTPIWRAQGDQAVALFGVSVATAGDLHGDGYDDVIVGAYYYDNGQIDEGAAFVYRGSASGLRRRSSRIPEGEQAGAQFGISVGTVGDVNGDGFDDVIVGANRYENGQHWEGRAFAWYGGPRM